MFDDVTSNITVDWDGTPTFVHNYDESDGHDHLGSSVDVSGQLIAAGAPYKDRTSASSNDGIVYALTICNYDLTGDLNDDCRVDLRDVAILSGNWLSDCILNPTDPACIAK